MNQGDEAFPMAARSTVERVLADNLYLVLGTADRDGRPWVSPVFFAQLDPNRFVWVSSPDSRHSRNITYRQTVALTVFNSTVKVGQAEAVYFDGEAQQRTSDEAETALRALNSRLPHDKQLSGDDLHPHGPMVVYEAVLRRRYMLVRGGNREFGNALDMTVEV